MEPQIFEYARYYRRDQLVVDERYNQRQYYGNLQELGHSVDKVGGFLLSLFAVPVDRINPKSDTPAPSEKVSIRDGFRRCRAFDDGCVTTLIEHWPIVVLADEHGYPLPESVVRRYMAVVNRKRKSWTPLEDARYFEAQINDALATELAAINYARETAGQGPLHSLSAADEKAEREKAIRALAEDDGVTPLTIRHRLELLELPGCVQKAIASDLVPADSARERFRGLAEDEALRLLRLAAEKNQFTLPVDIAGEVHTHRGTTPSVAEAPPQTAPQIPAPRSAPPAGALPRPNTKGTVRTLASGSVRTSNPTSPLPDLQAVPDQDDGSGDDYSNVTAMEGLFDDDGPSLATSPETQAETSSAEDLVAPATDATARPDHPTIPLAEPVAPITGEPSLRKAGKRKLSAGALDEARAELGHGAAKKVRLRSSRDVERALIAYQQRARDGDDAATSVIQFIRWLMRELKELPS